MLIKILRAAVSVPVNCNRQAETATLLERLVKSVTEENESEALHLCGPANPEGPEPRLPGTVLSGSRVGRRTQSLLQGYREAGSLQLNIGTLPIMTGLLPHTR